MKTKRGGIRLFISLLLTVCMLSAMQFPAMRAASQTALPDSSAQAKSNSEPAKLVIGMVYFGTDSSSAGTHSFVEIYNPNEFSVSLSDTYSLQYKCMDPDKTPGWEKLDLEGEIPAHHSFLVNMGDESGSAGGTGTKGRLDLTGKAFDQNFGLPLAKLHSKGVKVVIMANRQLLPPSLHNPFDGDGAGRTQGYVDMFGVSGNDGAPTVPSQQADGYETACIMQGASDAQSKQKGYVRLSAGSERYVDTDNNLANFQQVDFRTSDLDDPLFIPRCLADGAWDYQAGNDKKTPEYVLNGAANTLWADGSALVSSDISAVKWHKDTDGKYYLFLPSTADLESLTIWHTFEGEARVGETALISGEPTAAFSASNGGEFVLTNNGKRYNIVVMKADDLPAMFITTEGDLSLVHQDKELKMPGKMMLAEKGETTAQYDGALDHIKGRGNTSWTLDKKPYNIKLPSASSLLGMDSSKKWSLLAVHSEPTVFRHKIMHDLASEIGLQYSPHSEYIDLVINGEYFGIYQLIERVDVGKNNLVKITDLTKKTEDVNSDELDSYPRFGPNDPEADSMKGYEIPNNPDDITGGYLLEFDDYRYYSEPSGFVTKRGQRVTIKSPENASREQVAYIKGFVEDMEEAIYSETGYNSKGKYYTDYIDAQAAAKFYLLQELAVNVDAGRNSCYFWKDTDKAGDGKLHSGPTWDWDAGLGFLGTQHGVDLSDPYTWWVNQSRRISDAEHTIYSALCMHSDFQKLVMEQWTGNVYPAVRILLGESQNGSSILKSLGDYGKSVASSYALNQKRWNRAGLESGISQLQGFIESRADFFNSAGFVAATAENISGAIREVKTMSYKMPEYALTSAEKERFENKKQDVLGRIESAVSCAEIAAVLQEYDYDISHFFSEPHDGKTARTIYYDNSSTRWSVPHYYIWGAQGFEEQWPGKAMTKVSGDIYMATVPAGFDWIIFNNNGSPQLATQRVRAHDSLIFTSNGPGYQSTVSGTDGVWAVYQGTEQGLNGAVSQFSDELKDLAASIDPVHYTEEEIQSLTERLQNGIRKIHNATLVSDAALAKEAAKNEILSHIKRVVYFDNSATKWTTVNFYTWNSGGEAFKWPGQEMTYVGNNIFKAVLPAGYDRVLYNNGEGQQTYDLNATDLEDKIHIAMEHNGGGKYSCAAVAYHPNTAVTVLVGDADENGAVNLSDVLSMQKHLARIKTLAGSGLTAADINNDGDVNMADVLLVMQYLARYSNDYDIGQPRQTSVWS